MSQHIAVSLIFVPMLDHSMLGGLRLYRYSEFEVHWSITLTGTENRSDFS